MQLDTDLTGLLGITVAIIALLARLPQVRLLPLRQKGGLLAVALIAVLIPLWGVSAAGLVRGITGDLSIATLALLVLALAGSLSGRVLVGEQNRRALLKFIVIVGAWFYPLALGLTMFDPYRLGYGNLWFMLALLGLAAWSALRYSTLLAWCIALAVAAWSVGWYESTNLWDYLLDPWLALYALAAQGRYWLRQRKTEAHA